MTQIDWSPFVYDDDRDERDLRDPYTVEQGREIFQLPVWTGCAGLKERMIAGNHVIHDSGYWVLLLAWCCGLRREEICKLMIDDIMVICA